MIAKPFLSALAVLLTLILGPALLIDLWLILPSGNQRARKAASSLAGTPVTLASIRAVPLLGISASGVRTGSGIGGLPLTGTSGTITLRPRLAALLGGRLEIASCFLDHPVLGMTLTPAQSPAPVPSLPSTPSPFSGPSAALPSPVATGKNTQAGDTGARENPRSPFTPQTRFRINHGEFHLGGPAGIPVLDLLDLSADVTGAPEGRISSAGVVIGSVLRFSDVKASARLKEETLRFADLSARLGGGTVTGDLSILSPLGTSPAYRTALSLRDADLGSLLSDASLGSSKARGSLMGTLQLEGRPGIGSTMQGHGEILCREVVVEPVDFLRKIGQILSIDELQLLQLSEGRCHFRVEGGHVVIDELFLKSRNLCLAAKGPVDSTGELNLDSRILLNDGLASRLRGLLGANMTPAPEPGYSQITFRVSGPAAHPRTDLLERLTGIRIGGDLGGLGNLLQGLGIFGKPRPTPAPQQPSAP